MRVSLLHGFAGDPSGWDATIADGLGDHELRALRLPRIAMRDTWDANLDAIDSDADVLIGYSFGARIALGLVAAGRVERIILVGVNPGLPFDRDSLAECAARRASDAAWATAWLALESGVPDRSVVHVHAGLATETEPYRRGQLLACGARAARTLDPALSARWLDELARLDSDGAEQLRIRARRRGALHTNLVMCDAY